jgi:hypothetical protein
VRVIFDGVEVNASDGVLDIELILEAVMVRIADEEQVVGEFGEMICPGARAVAIEERCFVSPGPGVRPRESR